MRAKGSLWRIEKWQYGRKEVLRWHKLLAKLRSIFLSLQEMEGDYGFITVSCRTVAFLIKQKKKKIVIGKNLKLQELSGP